MQFIYHEESGKEKIIIKDSNFVHIFKSRRTKINQELLFSNLSDETLYLYKILEINKKDAICELVNSSFKAIKSKDFTLALAVIDPKTIEKIIPYLNEIGVCKIVFVYMQFSQQNFKIDFDKLKRININSCEQCGRNSLIKFEIYKTIGDFLKIYQDIVVVDFSENKITNDIKNFPKTWLVGCEGGFSNKEKELLKNFITVGFDCENILKSETAVIAISSKFLL